MPLNVHCMPIVYRRGCVQNHWCGAQEALLSLDIDDGIKEELEATLPALRKHYNEVQVGEPLFDSRIGLCHLIGSEQSGGIGGVPLTPCSSVHALPQDCSVPPCMK